MATGVELLAAVAATWRLLGLGPGDEIGSFDARLHLSYVEESRGKGTSRTVRRDYGLFEAAFEPGWGMRCSSMLIEVHRLAAEDGLPFECRSVDGVELPRLVAWSELRRFLEQAGVFPAGGTGHQEGEFVRYELPKRGTVVHVLNDAQARRGALPGDGDVWSIDLGAGA